MTSKVYQILIPKSVEIALENQLDYVLNQSGKNVAQRWLDGLVAAIDSLSLMPQRCAIAPENNRFKKPNSIIRHLIYKKTFRIIFIIVKNEVRVLSVKHAAREKVL